MTGNQVVSTMFDFNTCNHMVWFVLWVMWLKTLDIIIIIQVAMEYVLFATHRSTVYVSWLCRLDWKICRTDPQCIPVAVLWLTWLHGSTMYDWWPWLLFMTSSIYDLCMGMPTSEIDICMILCWCLMFAGLWVDVLLVLDTHIQLTKSFDCHWFHSQTLGGILLSTFLVIEMMTW